MPYESSSALSNAYLTSIKEQQIMTKMTELMAKKLSTFEPGTWVEIQNEFRKKAEEFYR